MHTLRACLKEKMSPDSLTIEGIAFHDQKSKRHNDQKLYGGCSNLVLSPLKLYFNIPKIKNLLILIRASVNACHASFVMVLQWMCNPKN